MSFLDKAKNAVQRTTGGAKEKTGAATGNKDLQAEGRKDQSKGDLKDAGEKVKDAFKH